MGFSGLAVGAALAGLRPMYVSGVYLLTVDKRHLLSDANS